MQWYSIKFTSTEDECTYSKRTSTSTIEPLLRESTFKTQKVETWIGSKTHRDKLKPTHLYNTCKATERDEIDTVAIEIAKSCSLPRIITECMHIQIMRWSGMKLPKTLKTIINVSRIIGYDREIVVGHPVPEGRGLPAHSSTYLHITNGCPKNGQIRRFLFVLNGGNLTLQ